MALIEQDIPVGQVLNWLEGELTSRNIKARIVRERVRERKEAAFLEGRESIYHIVLVPIHRDNENQDESDLLVEIAEAWNDC